MSVWLQMHTFAVLNCVTRLSVDGMGVSLRRGEEGFGLTSRCIAWPLTEMGERERGKDGALLRGAPLDMLCLRNLHLLSGFRICHPKLCHRRIRILFN